jgi:hypothetical protein
VGTVPGAVVFPFISTFSVVGWFTSLPSLLIYSFDSHTKTFFLSSFPNLRLTDPTALLPSSDLLPIATQLVEKLGPKISLPTAWYQMLSLRFCYVQEMVRSSRGKRETWLKEGFWWTTISKVHEMVKTIK